MSINLVVMLYLIASVCFIQALKGLSHPSTARRGNAFGMSGMAIAVVTTIAMMMELKSHQDSAGYGLGLVAAGVAVGGVIGATLAKKVEMTKMPELVAAMHSLIGLAAVCIAVAVVSEPWAFGLAAKGAEIPYGNRIELFIGTFVGAITFSGSVIAFGKLSGNYKFRLFQGAPVSCAGQHWVNLVMALAMLGLGITFCVTQSWTPFLLMTAIAFTLGVLIIIPIGGADMPVVVSMLNSYSGWAAAGIGFSLNNSMLIIAGSLVGSSGAILSYIMCKAMNRSFFNVLLGGFGGAPAEAGFFCWGPVWWRRLVSAILHLEDILYVVTETIQAVQRGHHAPAAHWDHVHERHHCQSERPAGCGAGQQHVSVERPDHLRSRGRGRSDGIGAPNYRGKFHHHQRRIHQKPQCRRVRRSGLSVPKHSSPGSQRAPTDELAFHRG